MNLERRARTILSGLQSAKRKRGFLLENLTPRKVANYARAFTSFATKRERLGSMPPAVKIDISPVCNLACTVCVHAEANGNAALEEQEFLKTDKMSVDQFRGIIDEIRGKSSTVSLYYLGDPYMHPDVDEMAGIAFDAGLNVHVSTNFSFGFTDDRIRQIVESGVTHMSVCVDGLSQEKYQLTRVRGQIARVLDNLERVVRTRDALGRRYPRIEVQYIKFQHNIDELEEARARFKELGVEQFTDFWGALHNNTDQAVENYKVVAPLEEQAVPRCYWPYTSMVIKYNGDVIPCCIHRMADQYSKTADPRALGNVFETSVREVWNSEEYQRSRRLSARPASIEDDESLSENFCASCPSLFEREEKGALRVRAVGHKWEDVYFIGDKGRPVRRDSPLASGREASTSDAAVDEGEPTSPQ